ncbi:MAG: hypothetical protein K8H75_00510 [Sulfuricella sp.]|nr:hypothetical protein [Sulfuricella sp.]
MTDPMHSLPRPPTPSGTRAYLTRKEAEYLALKSEIETMRIELAAQEGQA